MAAADASFSTVTEAMSFGLMPAMPLLKMSLKSSARSWLLAILGRSCCKGTPSTTHSGSALPVMVLVPRMRMWAVCPGRPETAFTSTPAILPCSSMSRLAVGAPFRSSAVSVFSEPVVRFLVVRE